MRILNIEKCSFVEYLSVERLTVIHVIQSGASSLAKHGGAYFSAVCGSIQDPIAAPGPYENQEF